jgi:hypothetical protein
MTDAEIYEFDLNGLIVIRNMLPPEMVAKLNTVLDAQLAGHTAWTFSFIDQNPIFMELLEWRRTLDIMRVMIGDWFRLDHAYGIQMTKQTSDVKDNLHGGPRTDQNEHCYQWLQGKMYNGLVVCAYALEDVNPGDGGFIGVPGSHKANHKWFPPVDSHLVVNPTLKAGDMLIFTEALIHGTRSWKSNNKRRSLLYKYSPGFSTWGPASISEKLLPLATTEMQKALLRPPFVGGRSPLPFESDAPVGGERGKMPLAT